MRLLISLSLATVLLAGSALAFAPRTTSFQGLLTDGNGDPIADGSHTVTFRIYDVMNGGAPLWSSSRQVQVTDGIFAVILGEVNPLNIPFDQAYYVGVQYEAEAEMTPRAPLTATPYALGVSEFAAVTSLNGLTGSFNLVAGSNVSINEVGGNLVIGATGAVADNDWTVSGANMYSTPAGNVGIGTSNPQSKLHVADDIMVGTPTAPAYVFAPNGGGFMSTFGGDYGDEGGELNMYQEDGQRYAFLQPDIDGDGGFLQITNGDLGTGFQVDGNWSSGNPLITMIGGSDAITFNFAQSGDALVNFPVDAIGAEEIEDEPGLASRSDHATSSYAIQSSFSPVTSRTITVPTDGYILATASCEIEMNHEGSACYVTAGLSTVSNGLPSNQDLSFYLPNSAAAGQYLIPSTPTAVFPVSAGSNTIYLVASRVGTSDAVMWDAQLNLLFVPTSYGAVALADGNDDGRQDQNNQVSSPMTAADISAEQRQSEQANQERIDRELAELRAQVAALRAEVEGQSVNGQPVSSR